MSQLTDFIDAHCVIHFDSVRNIDYKVKINKCIR